ncbi:hypothetical protein [Cumulibacter manganitolerans]|uniref:hypothetical protein n=1 Tax=Cumulibacter manganitolerans TaxID=1884992 RepID=UPI00129807AD|nr:hypothetical protein [Cumulibacter manganitolerans]
MLACAAAATSACSGGDVTQPSGLSAAESVADPAREPAEDPSNHSASGSSGASGAGPASSSSAAPSAPPTIPPPSSAPPTIPPADQAALAAYKHYYETIYTLGTPSAQQVRTAFAPYAEKHVIDNWVAVFAQFAADGTRPSGQVTFGAIQVSVTAGTATVYECRDATTETMSKVSTGELVSHGSPGMRIDSQLNLGGDGRWRITSSGVQPNGC